MCGHLRMLFMIRGVCGTNLANNRRGAQTISDTYVDVCQPHSWKPQRAHVWTSPAAAHTVCGTSLTQPRGPCCGGTSS